MKLLRIIGIFAIFLIVIGVVALNVVLSIKNDISNMQYENPAVFLINPESGEIDLGLGIDRKSGSVILADSRHRIGDIPLRALFKNSEESGASAIIGSMLPGYTYSDGGVERKSVLVERVVLIDDTVVAEIFSLAEPQKVEFGERGGFFHAESVVDKDGLLGILRGEFEKLRWKVTITNPLLGEPTTRSATTEELLKIAESMGVGLDRDLVKVLILAQVAEKARLELQSDEARMEVFRIVLREYKRGTIRTYPENTLTKVIKFLPEERILKQLEAKL
jgi:hypothetical protein